MSIPQVPLLINGEFVQSKTTERRDVVNPATQEVIARVPMADPMMARVTGNSIASMMMKGMERRKLIITPSAALKVGRGMI